MSRRSPRNYVIASGTFCGVVVPISSFLVEHGEFLPEIVAAITAAFEECLQTLGVTEQSDPLALAVAKQIVRLAKQGERDPIRLRDKALTSFKRGSAKPSPGVNTTRTRSRTRC